MEGGLKKRRRESKLYQLLNNFTTTGSLQKVSHLAVGNLTEGAFAFTVDATVSEVLLAVEEQISPDGDQQELQLHAFLLPNAAFLVVENPQPAVDAAVEVPALVAVVWVELHELLEQFVAAVVEGLEHLLRNLDEAKGTLTLKRTRQFDQIFLGAFVGEHLG